METRKRSKKYIDIFVSMMRKKCSEIDLRDTVIVCPCGLSYDNRSSALDVLKILLHAAHYKEICNYWGKKKYNIEIGRDSIVFDMPIVSTISGDLPEYKIVGGKTGSDGCFFNIATIVRFRDEFYACVVLNAKSEIDRENAICKLMDFAGGKEKSSKIENITSGIVAKIKKNDFVIDEYSIDILYEQNSNISVPILSITKLIAAMVLLDFKENLQSCIKVSKHDIQRGSGAFLKKNDIITYKDALISMLLPSSNTASYLIARNIGLLKFKELNQKERMTIKGFMSKALLLLSPSFYQYKYNRFLESHNWSCLLWEKTKLRYKNVTGKDLDYKNPKDLNEKLLWLTRYWQHPIKTKCADKFLVRDYLKEKGFEKILIPLIGVWDSVSQIDFNQLPNQFVLKCNHGCNYNIICHDKTSLNIEFTKASLDKWMKEDFYLLAQEIHYKNIRRKIICETLLDENVAPLEYQVWCVNGKADSFLVCRKNWDGSYDSWSYSLNWKRLYDRFVESPEDLEEPKNRVEIINVAEQLANGIPFLRADFYEVNGRLYFAEMTFTPAANILKSYKQDFLDRMGEKLALPPKYV